MRHKSTKLQQSLDPDSIDRMQKMGLAFSLFHYESLLSKVYAGIQGTHRFKSNLDVDEISAYPQRILGENGSLREFYKPACLACRGGGFFHNKGTWGCAARKGILFRASSLAKGILLVKSKSGQGYVL